MPRPLAAGHSPADRSNTAAPQTPAWKLEDAKARFGEVVRRARTQGPQRVTVRGKDAVVVIAAEALDNLMPPPPPPGLVVFLQSTGLADLDLTREPDSGRDVVL
jgi:prevent-host-death family protein